MRRVSRRLLAKDIRAESRTAAVLQQFHPIPADAIRTLERNLHGNVVLPTDATYHSDRQEWNPAFQDFPQMIAYCEVISDVRACLEFARDHDLRVVCRSGRHSTAGYSVNNSMVIDTSRLCYTVVDPERKIAHIGPGTPFSVMNSILNDYRLHVPGGACQDVCVAGFMQGGGYGFTSRGHGMNCDNVLSVTVMLWDGSIVVANDEKNADLFWAIRGGTGNNFGVLLEVTYRLCDLYEVCGFHVEWKIKDAADALKLLQDDYMKDGVCDRFGYYAFVANQNGENVLLVSGLYDGPEKETRELLQPLLDAGGELLKDPVLGVDINVGPYSAINSWLYDEKYDIPIVPDNAREDKQSGYIARPLSQDDWQKVIDYFETTPNEYGTIAIEPYGGAINRKPCGIEGNAFIHRDVYMNFYVDVFWVSETDKKIVVKWLDGFMEMMEPHFNEHSYQNYPRRSQTNYRWLYWGDSFNSLLFVKNKYDPKNFFCYQQSISEVPDDAPPEIRRDDSRSMFSDPAIEYEVYSRPYSK